jgi:hypothetical protein
MTDLRELSTSAAACTPEQIAAHLAAAGVPEVPCIRPAADELRGFPQNDPTPNGATKCP